MEKEYNDPTPGGQREVLAKTLPLKMPWLVQIFPVYGCNFRCEYCIHSLERSRHGYISNDILMPWDVYKKVIDDIRDTGKRIKMLRFAAIGEPLLHPQIAEMVSYAQQSSVADSVDIVTNGSLLTKELSDRLIDARLSKLRISVEGLSAEEYRDHTSAEIDFAKMVENIHYFYERCMGTPTTMYIKIIDYMVQSKEQQDRFRKIFAPITHSIAIEHLTPTIEEIDYDKVSHGMKTDKPQNGMVLLDAQICPQPFYMMQVNPDGNVVPCCSMKYPCVLGNVREESVQDIWLGEKYRSFQRNMLEGVSTAAEVCGKCTLYRYDLHEEDQLDADAGQLKSKY